MSKEFPQQEQKRTSKEIADSVLFNIGRAWDRINDIEGLPLSADDVYQIIRNELEMNAFEYAGALFDQARNTTGEERMKYIRGLERMLKIIDSAVGDRVLKGLMTNNEALFELRRKAAEEIPAKARAAEKVRPYREFVRDFLSFLRKKK